MQVFLALPRYPFTRAAIEFAPDEPGIMGLFDGEELIYIGRAANRRDHSIRALLLRHHQGSFGECTMKATHYTWEIVVRGALEREDELLAQYFESHQQGPRCGGKPKAA